MEALAGRETVTWTEVERLLESDRPKAYDSAVGVADPIARFWRSTKGRRRLSNCELTTSLQSTPDGRA